MTWVDFTLAWIAALSLGINAIQQRALSEMSDALDVARQEVRLLKVRVDMLLPSCGSGQSNADAFLHAQMQALREGRLDVGNHG